MTPICGRIPDRARGLDPGRFTGLTGAPEHHRNQICHVTALNLVAKTWDSMASDARRMLALNDGVFGKLTQSAHEREIVLGVPHDIVCPAILHVLQRFAKDCPKMKVMLRDPSG